MSLAIYSLSASCVWMCAILVTRSRKGSRGKREKQADANSNLKDDVKGAETRMQKKVTGNVCV